MTSVHCCRRRLSALAKLCTAPRRRLAQNRACLIARQPATAHRATWAEVSADGLRADSVLITISRRPSQQSLSRNRVTKTKSERRTPRLGEAESVNRAKGLAMYQHYETENISDQDLDRLVAEAEERAEGTAPELVVAEPDAATDDAIDAWLANEVDRLVDNIDEPHRPGIDSYDVFTAADECGLVLGSVLQAPNRSLVIVRVDYDAVFSAAAWATVSSLPEWVGDGYRELVLAQGKA